MLRTFFVSCCNRSKIQIYFDGLQKCAISSGCMSLISGIKARIINKRQAGCWRTASQKRLYYPIYFYIRKFLLTTTKTRFRKLSGLENRWIRDPCATVVLELHWPRFYRGQPPARLAAALFSQSVNSLQSKPLLCKI